MHLTREHIDAYCLSLLADERSAGTISKYRRDLTAFARWLDGRAVTKESATAWKACLLNRDYAPRTINSMLAAVNGFCRFAGLPIKLKFLSIQRQIFRDSAKELTKEEYDRLLTAAQESDQERLALIMETLCATGIRVSELRYIAVEAALAGRVTITLNCDSPVTRQKVTRRYKETPNRTEQAFWSDAVRFFHRVECQSAQALTMQRHS